MTIAPETLARARRYVLQRARPLELSRWGFHFEREPASAVLRILSSYQNPDGGFGHGLEPDFWNPNSSPMQTWAATEVLRSLGSEVQGHPLIDGILNYLVSGADFDGTVWARTVASTNTFPHAPWWSHGGDDGTLAPRYNPTAALAGFALVHAPSGSPAALLATRIAREALQFFLTSTAIEVHELSCFSRLIADTCSVNVDLDVNLELVRTTFENHVDQVICRDPRQWASGYVCRPSRFLRTEVALTRLEADFLQDTQLDDGSWPVLWSWDAYPSEWPVAREWWKSIGVLENLQFLKELEDGGTDREHSL